MDSTVREIDPNKGFYVEARVGSDNYRGDCVRFIQDRRGSDGAYLNIAAEEVIKQLLAKVEHLKQLLIEEIHRK